MPARVTPDGRRQEPKPAVTRLRPPVTDLPSLRAAFPDFTVTEDRRRTPPRFSAVANDLGPGLAAVVTDDLEELAQHLREATGRKP